jgi:hypothetical protein
MRAAGFGGVAGTIVTTFVAVICAALLTVLFGIANGRSIYARQG